MAEVGGAGLGLLMGGLMMQDIEVKDAVVWPCGAPVTRLPAHNAAATQH